MGVMILLLLRGNKITDKIASMLLEFCERSGDNRSILKAIFIPISCIIGLSMLFARYAAFSYPFFLGFTLWLFAVTFFYENRNARKICL
jgi:hypothetical protein